VYLRPREGGKKGGVSITGIDLKRELRALAVMSTDECKNRLQKDYFGLARKKREKETSGQMRRGDLEPPVGFRKTI